MRPKYYVPSIIGTIAAIVSIFAMYPDAVRGVKQMFGFSAPSGEVPVVLPAVLEIDVPQAIALGIAHERERAGCPEDVLRILAYTEAVAEPTERSGGKFFGNTTLTLVAAPAEPITIKSKGGAETRAAALAAGQQDLLSRLPTELRQRMPDC